MGIIGFWDEGGWGLTVPGVVGGGSLGLGLTHWMGIIYWESK